MIAETSLTYCFKEKEEVRGNHFNANKARCTSGDLDIPMEIRFLVEAVGVAHAALSWLRSDWAGNYLTMSF